MGKVIFALQSDFYSGSAFDLLQTLAGPPQPGDILTAIIPGTVREMSSPTGAEKLLLKDAFSKKLFASKAGEGQFPVSIVHDFEERSRKTGFRYRLHAEAGSEGIFDEFLYQSFFSDLAVLAFPPGKKYFQTTFNCGCPLLAAAASAGYTDHIIFLYNDKPEEVKAIRQFIRDFPYASANLMFTLLSSCSSVKNEKLLIDLLKAGTRNLGVRHLAGEDIKDEILNFIYTCSDVLLVLPSLESTGTMSLDDIDRLMQEENVSFYFANC